MLSAILLRLNRTHVYAVEETFDFHPLSIVRLSVQAELPILRFAVTCSDPNHEQIFFQGVNPVTAYLLQQIQPIC